MRDFAAIEAIAAERHGGGAALAARLATPLAPAALARLPLSVWLEAMAKALFQAGFSWRVIEAKWPGFQAAFAGFEPASLGFWHDEEIERLLADTRIIRNGGKIAAVLANARFLTALQAETGDAAAHLALWPAEDHAGLLDLLARRGARLGGTTGQRVCRLVGREGYVLTPDVLKRLAIEGVVEGPATSKAAMARVQAAFNRWRAESGRPLTQISQILALSVD
jgi:3-methyladenine DNA glycosylase Tag